MLPNPGILYKRVIVIVVSLSACFCLCRHQVLMVVKCLWPNARPQHHTPRAALSLGWMHHPQSKGRVRTFSVAAFQESTARHPLLPQATSYEAQVCLPWGWTESYSVSLSPGWGRNCTSGPSVQLPVLQLPFGACLSASLAVRRLLEDQKHVQEDPWALSENLLYFPLVWVLLPSFWETSFSNWPHHSSTTCWGEELQNACVNATLHCPFSYKPGGHWPALMRDQEFQKWGQNCWSQKKALPVFFEKYSLLERMFQWVQTQSARKSEKKHCLGNSVMSQTGKCLGRTS